MKIKATNNLKSYISVYSFFWFYIAFNTVQVISQEVVERAEETRTDS